MRQRVLLFLLFIGLLIISIWSVQAETFCTDCTCESCCQERGYISGECRSSCLDGETEEFCCNSFCDCSEKCCCIPAECECDVDEDCPCPSDECDDYFLYDYPDYGICLGDCTCDVCEGCEGPCEPTIIDCSEKDSETGYCKCDCGPYISTNGEDTVDCDDGIDNDCDGLIDDEDLDCVPTTTTTTTTTTTRVSTGGGRKVYIIITTTTTTSTTTTTLPPVKVDMDIVNLTIPSDILADEAFELGVEVNNTGDEGTDDILIALPEHWIADKWGERVNLKPDEVTILHFSITPTENSGKIAAASSTDFEVSDKITPKVKAKPMPTTGWFALSSLGYSLILIIIVVILLIVLYFLEKRSRKEPTDKE